MGRWEGAGMGSEVVESGGEGLGVLSRGMLEIIRLMS